MSGGQWNYIQYAIDDLADQMVREFKSQSELMDETTQSHYVTCYRELKKISVYLQRLDWLLSYDDSQETYHERLAEDLEDTKGWESIV